jgi:cytochrome c-type biogenesis protein CcmE
MDPHRKRAIRMTFALTSAVLLASALIWTSFSAGRDELTAGQLISKARPGQSYILAGTVGRMHQNGTGLVFTVRDPKLPESVTVDYTGIVPDPMAVGRGVLVDVTAPKAGIIKSGTAFVGQNDSLTTKCPSKYQVAPPKPTPKSAIPAAT